MSVALKHYFANLSQPQKIFYLYYKIPLMTLHCSQTFQLNILTLYFKEAEMSKTHPITERFFFVKRFFFSSSNTNI